MAIAQNKLDLNTIQIASPCTEDWDKMTGDDRSRHCLKCNLNVFNIASMSKEDAEQMIARGHKGGRVCVRLFRRHDGTVLTKDCPVGLRRTRLLWLKIQSIRIAALALVFGAFAIGRYLMTGKTILPVKIQKHMLMGDIAFPETGSVSVSPSYQELKGKVQMPDPKTKN